MKKPIIAELCNCNEGLHNTDRDSSNPKLFVYNIIDGNPIQHKTTTNY